MPAVGVGIVGASLNGGWALQSHVPALLALSEFEIVAVSTTRVASAEKTAKHFGVRHFYDSADALAADPLVDLVSVTVKVPDHEAAVGAAITAGKSVYCEWPLGVDSAQAVRMRDHAAAAGIRTTVGLQARSTPVLRFVRDLVHDGYLGRLLSTHANSAGFGNGGPVLEPDREWAADDSNGLSTLTVRAAHTLDAAQFCVGRIAELSSEVLVASPHATIGDTGRVVRRTAPDQVFVQGVLEGGSSISGRFLQGVRADRASLLTIHGTERTILVVGDGQEPQIQMATLRILVARRHEPFRPLPVPPGYVRAPSTRPMGPANSVAENYLGLTGDQSGGSTSPDFDDAVLLHALLDVIRSASSVGARQVVSDT